MQLTKFQMNSIYPFATDYLANKPKVLTYFPYHGQCPEDFAKRAAYLSSKQNFERDHLADYITNFMTPYGLSEQALDNIAALRSDALVVVGGQQAGVLTGPLYTIHKIISVIQLAKQQSVALGKKVVPVFWIAGEDHDYPEVNHLFLKKEGRLVKKQFPYQPKSKEMVSDMALDSVVAQTWLAEVMAALGETERSDLLFKWLEATVSAGGSLVDFFVRLVNDLFHDTGLLLVDSGDPAFRTLGKATYQQILENHAAITETILTRQANITASGYKRFLEIESDAVNLFYYTEQKERVLLSFDVETGRFVGKAAHLSFTKEALLKIAAANPERFSTNVATRPILQEKLLPVLAFVAGPGEIAYWGELAKAFETVGEVMPPVCPRLSITLLERNVASKVVELNLQVETVIRRGCQTEKTNYLKSLQHGTVQAGYEQLCKQVEVHYQNWSKVALQYDAGLKLVFEKNYRRIIEELAWMDSKVTEGNLRRNQETIRKFEEIENSLYPNSGPQERVLNLFYFLNQYGAAWLEFLLQSELSFDDSHYVVVL